MDLEEERLRHQVEARELALQQKINALGERIEGFKRMADVKSQVRRRPGLMLTGSILAGFLTKKLAGRKNRYSAYPQRSNFPRVPTPGAAASAIISAIGTRAAIAIIGEVVGQLLPGKQERGQPSKNVSTNGQRSSGN